MPFKINISEKGKTYKIELAEPDSEALVGKKIGDKVDGGEVSAELKGYELEITGASDKAGFPAKVDVEGIGLKKVLLKKGFGMRRSSPKGLRLRKTVSGNTISSDIVQINMKVITVKEGTKKLEEIFKEQIQKKEEKIKEKQAKKEEEVVEKKKEEKPKEIKEEKEKMEEKPKEKKEESKSEEKKEEKEKEKIIKADEKVSMEKKIEAIEKEKKEVEKEEVKKEEKEKESKEDK